MRKFLQGFLVVATVFCLAACGSKKEEEQNPSEGKQEETKALTADELKAAVRKAGYTVNDYIACMTGLTEDQMSGFTVTIYKSAEESSDYCVIVAKSEEYAKQACETVQNEFNTCIRNGSTIVFPEYNASSDVQKMLTSIVDGKPITPISYSSAE